MSLVTVLTPNGRRQNVKVTPNTTILQVLEEVCNKHGFKPEEHDLKHHKKILDVTSIFRFSGLPNNAQLELVEAKRQRSETSVVLGVQIESGERFTGEFVPSESLWTVITKLLPENINLNENPVVIYMRREISGKENLDKTTLRSLGLTGGRAMLRFLQKTPEELRNQANVSAVISRPFVSVEKKVEKEETLPAPEKHEKSNQLNLIDQIKQEKCIKEDESDMENIPNNSQVDNKMEIQAKSNIVKEESPKPQRKVNLESKPEPKPKPQINETKTEELSGSMEETKVILLGERNAVAYNLNNVKTPVFEDVSDDFFELTVSDAKLLLKEAKKYCEELEEAPLMNAAQRELEQSKKTLSLLNQHRKTVLRIKFPDRTVLQGTFAPLEPISAVEKFVSDYLENPKLSFYLYTTPPKRILKSEDRLVDCDCVPCCILYLGLNGETDEKHFLRADVLEKFSTPSAAALTACKSRGLNKTEGESNKAKSGPSAEAGPSKTQELKSKQKSDQGKKS